MTAASTTYDELGALPRRIAFDDGSSTRRQALQLLWGFNPSSTFSVAAIESNSAGPLSIPAEPDLPKSRDHTHAVFAALRSIRTAAAYHSADEGTVPNEAALDLAESILAYVSDILLAPKIGLGGDGDLYFSWENEEGSAFLTIEDGILHLLLKPRSAKPVYLDRIPHDQTVLANKILPRLIPFARTDGGFPRTVRAGIWQTDP